MTPEEREERLEHYRRTREKCVTCDGHGEVDTAKGYVFTFEPSLSTFIPCKDCGGRGWNPKPILENVAQTT